MKGYRYRGRVFATAETAADFVWDNRRVLGDLGLMAEREATRRMDRFFDSPSDLWWTCSRASRYYIVFLPERLLADALAEEPGMFAAYGLEVVP